MSLLSIVTTVGAEAAYDVDSVVVQSTQTTTKQLYSMANRVVQETAEAYLWAKLNKTASFSLVDGQATYALPADFSHYHHDTFWNNSTGWRIYGAINPLDYAEIVHSGLNIHPFGQFTVRGMTDKEITILPTPTSANAGQIIYFEYTSARYVRPRTWVEGNTIATSEYCFYKGNYYISTNSGTTGTNPPTHTSGTASDDNIDWLYYRGEYKSFLKDTDEPLFNERVISQGVYQRFCETKGLEHEKRWASQVDEEYGRPKTDSGAASSA